MSLVEKKLRVTSVQVQWHFSIEETRRNKKVRKKIRFPDILWEKILEFSPIIARYYYNP